MNLERLLRSDLRAVADRGAQEARKWLERSRLAGAIPRRDFHASGVVRAAAAFADHRRSRAGHFFPGALDPAVPRLLEQPFPGARVQALERVEACERGSFDLLGYRGLTFGAPVDWMLDPISRKRAPRAHWSELDPLDRASVGDSKVIWELNRHQWLLAYAQAYAFTREERYAERLLAWLRDWREANPEALGINWASSLELSLRVLSWCWALHLVRGSPSLRLPELERLLASVRLQALHVESYLSRHFSPNTHLTGEALGLFCVGTAFPELREASRWRALGGQILTEQCERHVLADGVYFERSTCYQRYTAEIYLHFVLLASSSGWPMPVRVVDALRGLLDFLLAICRPDGSMPEIGDADGGWLLPLEPRAPSDLRGLFSTAAAWFHRSDYAWAAGGLAPETLWLLGQRGTEPFAQLHPAPPESAPLRLFPEGGYAVQRSGWASDAHQLGFDFGPLGCPHSAGHGHADLLSIQCSAFGEPVLVDPGTYCYQAEPAWRDRFRSSAFHSTVTLDGESQAVPAGPFRWEERPAARLLDCRSSPGLELLDAVHDAYRRLEDPVRHRRRVLFVERRFWVVIDDLEGAQPHRIELRFQLAPLPVALEPSGWARVKTRGGHALLLRAFATAPLEPSLVEGQLEPPLGWISPAYGQKTPAPQLLWTGSTRLPLRIASVLFPLDDAAKDPPAIRPLVEEGRLRALELEGQGTALLDGTAEWLARAGPPA